MLQGQEKALYIPGIQLSHIQTYLFEFTSLQHRIPSTLREQYIKQLMALLLLSNKDLTHQDYAPLQTYDLDFVIALTFIVVVLLIVVPNPIILSHLQASKTH